MAGRYDSNPFDEEEVNPFSVSPFTAGFFRSKLRFCVLGLQFCVEIDLILFGGCFSVLFWSKFLIANCCFCCRFSVDLFNTIIDVV